MFGAMTALRLSYAGFSVEVFERKSEPLRGASYNNQNRLHLGFHYPRDSETARQCVRGFKRFCEEFSECINGDFLNCYFVAREGSLTSPADYLRFCRELKVDHQEFAIGDFPIEVRKVALAIRCPEAVYDAGLLRELVLARMRRSKVVLSHRDVAKLSVKGPAFELTFGDGSRQEFDAIVNASYANLNRFDADLGLSVSENQYEYTFVPVLEIPFPRSLGVTIMDGSFMTVLPFGKTGRYLLYHVERTVIERCVQQLLPREWLATETGPLAGSDRVLLARQMVEACADFVPALASARVVGHLEGPRMVLARRDDTDARPSIVQSPVPNYITIFSGKIDHCVWVADDVTERLSRTLKGYIT
jgi:hypothetical protein